MNERLQQSIKQYHAARERHDRKRSDCNRRLLETRIVAPVDGLGYRDEAAAVHRRVSLPDPSYIKNEMNLLRQQLNLLRTQSNAMAVRLTAKTVENDQKEEGLRSNSEDIQLARDRLDRMRKRLTLSTYDDESQVGSGIIGGGLQDALSSGMREIKSVRFRYACLVFDMHRLDIGEQYAKLGRDAMHNVIASGVGKIGGLPLPHAGLALYGVIPQLVLSSSLRLVASLTQMVARCLGVVLPHPILVCFSECVQCGSLYGYGDDLIDLGGDDSEDEHDEGIPPSGMCNVCINGIHVKKQVKPQPHTASELLQKPSLLKFVGSSARKALSSAASHALNQMQQPEPAAFDTTHSSSSRQKVESPKKIPSEGNEIEKRIRLASFACLREDQNSSTEYVLNPPRWNDDKKKGNGNQSAESIAEFASREEFHVAEERFGMGLQLLQNNIVALCFRAGVDISTLWPAESLLLNLHSLWMHCQAEST
mmetsp:Transcript_18546/g.41286  ORF Transcript_18546/g.41286 Transcript_18546/m.41286 type:complete len:479 (-) Transcript_18546:60-1496(-)